MRCLLERELRTPMGLGPYEDFPWYHAPDGVTRWVDSGGALGGVAPAEGSMAQGWGTRLVVWEHVGGGAVGGRRLSAAGGSGALLEGAAATRVVGRRPRGDGRGTWYWGNVRARMCGVQLEFFKGVQAAQ